MVYKFRLLSDEKENFARDFEVRSNQTFYDLHQVIQKNLHYDQSQVASFFICNDQWEKEQEITLFDLSDESLYNPIAMGNAIFSDHITGLKQKLLYVFDFFNERAFFIEVVDIQKETPGKTYPVCTLSRGSPPEQIIMDQIYNEGDPLRDIINSDIETSEDESFFSDSGFNDLFSGDQESDEE